MEVVSESCCQVFAICPSQRHSRVLSPLACTHITYKSESRRQACVVCELTDLEIFALLANTVTMVHRCLSIISNLGCQRLLNGLTGVDNYSVSWRRPLASDSTAVPSHYELVTLITKMKMLPILMITCPCSAKRTYPMFIDLRGKIPTPSHRCLVTEKKECLRRALIRAPCATSMERFEWTMGDDDSSYYRK